MLIFCCLQKKLSAILSIILIIVGFSSCCVKRGSRGATGPATSGLTNCTNEKKICTYFFVPINNDQANCTFVPYSLSSPYVFGCNDPDTPNCTQQSPTIPTNMQVTNDPLNDPTVCPTVGYEVWSATEPYLNSNYYWELEADLMRVYFSYENNPNTFYNCEPELFSPSNACGSYRMNTENGIKTQKQGPNIGKQYFLVGGYIFNFTMENGPVPLPTATSANVYMCVEYVVQLSATHLGCN